MRAAELGRLHARQQTGVVLWFTGLSGAGKTTIAAFLKCALEQKGKRVVVLDGDSVRATLHRHLGFSREDIRENNRRITELAREQAMRVDFVLVPIISPYRFDRAAAREAIGEGFIELYIHCPLAICEQRDTKGLYARAAAGEIDNLIGVSAVTPYESPEYPDFLIRSDGESPAQSVNNVMGYLQRTSRL